MQQGGRTYQGAAGQLHNQTEGQTGTEMNRVEDLEAVALASRPASYVLGIGLESQFL